MVYPEATLFRGCIRAQAKDGPKFWKGCGGRLNLGLVNKHFVPTDPGWAKQLIVYESKTWKFGGSVCCLVLGQQGAHPWVLSKSYGEGCFFAVSHFLESRSWGVGCRAGDFFSVVQTHKAQVNVSTVTDMFYCRVEKGKTCPFGQVSPQVESQPQFTTPG